MRLVFESKDINKYLESSWVVDYDSNRLLFGSGATAVSPRIWMGKNILNYLEYLK